jgi:hypothetical protein
LFFARQQLPHNDSDSPYLGSERSKARTNQPHRQK